MKTKYVLNEFLINKKLISLNINRINEILKLNL